MTSTITIFTEASEAARAAWEAATPRPIIVGESKALFGPDSNSIDYTKPTYYVADGVCGFAWVRIRPARGPMVTWLKKQGIGHKGYRGGWEVSSYEFGGVGRSSQSYERAYAAARAAAKVFEFYGITAHADGRLD